MFGLTRFKTYAVAVALALSTLVGTAQASTLSATCGDDSSNYVLSSDDGTVATITCYATGTTFSFLDAGLHAMLIDDGFSFTGYIGRHVTVGADAVGEFFSGLFDLLGGTGGSFDVNQAVDAVLVFEMAPRLCGPQTLCEPVYGAFEISTTGAAILDWAFSPHDQGHRGLNHVSVWMSTAPVPLPAAGLMLLGGLGVLGAAKRRRKTA